MPIKSIFIIFDALRYDLFVDKNIRKNLFPEIDKIIKKGFLTKAVANAQSTQFVLPSLWTSSYPLDYGGYDFGIRNRNSYIKDIQKSKIKTYMMSTCNQMGVGNGYDDQFDQVYATNDYRLIIEQKINRTILYNINLYKTKQITKKQIITYLQKEFGITLNKILSFKSVNDDLWPKKLKKINRNIILNSNKEKEILLQNPEIILNKMMKVSGGSYWLTLGKKKYESFSYKFKRLLIAISWRLKGIIEKQNIWPFLKLGHFVVAINDIIDDIVNKILCIKEENWHIHMHFMDVHDYRAINNPIILIKRFRFFPRWFSEKIKGNMKHKFLYVAAAMDLDQSLGKIIKALEKKKIIDNVLLLITADHALYYPESPRKKLEVEFRTHYEDLDIPFIMSKSKQLPNSDIMCDSMDIVATFVNELGINLHEKYKGKNFFYSKKKFVISESCGRGNSDTLRKPVFFTVSTKKFRMMATLNNKELRVRKFFSLINDPRELYDLSNNESYKKDINSLLEILYKNRKEIFLKKGFSKPTFLN